MKINKDLLKRINEILYEDNTTTVSEEDVTYMLEELVSEIDRLEEELEDYKEYVNENYRPISTKEMYGIDDRDFIEML